ncbi:hypothetical protein [Sedimentitalea arenosa]|jgi:hypothetical protein|uniref:Lipoprotein n=1 Tax=Sedimentitalea arenosa TaxID=2798803 RepID=A0A8J7LWK0_9RHOB|nr:hypothetical protein [Arenibacterium arenosum]MBJ6372321.1 hypothetical protein [Arenibacterium arenosum]
MTLLRASLLPALLLLAACAVPDNPSRSGAGGETQIQLSDGQNCWNNRCFRFSSVNRSVQVTGKYPVRAPRDIDLRDGYVTEAQFAAMFQTANMAYANGVGRR